MGGPCRNPLEPWRPVAVLRASQGHVVRLRPPGSLPDALSATIYIAMAMPALSPFVPIYKVACMLLRSPAWPFWQCRHGCLEGTVAPARVAAAALMPGECHTCLRAIWLHKPCLHPHGASQALPGSTPSLHPAGRA